jgi:hypothetical protein
MKINLRAEITNKILNQPHNVLLLQFKIMGIHHTNSLKASRDIPNPKTTANLNTNSLRSNTLNSSKSYQISKRVIISNLLFPHNGSIRERWVERLLAQPKRRGTTNLAKFYRLVQA